MYRVSNSLNIIYSSIVYNHCIWMTVRLDVDTKVRVLKIYLQIIWDIWMPWGADSTLTWQQNLINGHIFHKINAKVSSYVCYCQKVLKFPFRPDICWRLRVDNTTENRRFFLYVVDGMYEVSKRCHIEAEWKL